MKRPRKPAAARPAAMSKDVAVIAESELEAAYRGFVTDTATEDPKRFLARLAAAREALEHLAELRGFAAEPQDHESSEEEVLEKARTSLAAENKT